MVVTCLSVQPSDQPTANKFPVSLGNGHENIVGIRLLLIGDLITHSLFCLKFFTVIKDCQWQSIQQRKFTELWSTNYNGYSARIDPHNINFLGNHISASRGCCPLKFLHCPASASAPIWSRMSAQQIEVSQFGKAYDHWSITTPPTLGQENLVNVGPLTKKL